MTDVGGSSFVLEGVDLVDSGVLGWMDTWDRVLLKTLAFLWLLSLGMMWLSGYMVGIH